MDRYSGDTQFVGDFHIHSTFSDGKLTIPELVDLYGSRGFGAIAITDHVCEIETVIGNAARVLGRTLTEANFGLYREILKSEAKRALAQYKMILIPGLELSKNQITNSRSAHILGLGISDLIQADLSVETICTEIRKQKGLSVAAHPVSTRKVEKQTFYLWDRRETLRNSIDLWEVASGVHLFDEVLDSGLPIIASSDLHKKEQLKSWKTIIYGEKSVHGVLEALRQQHIEFNFYQESSNGIYPLYFSDDLARGYRPDHLRNTFGSKKTPCGSPESRLPVQPVSGIDS